MPYCPECGFEYRSRVKRCPDCGADLVEAPPPERPAWPAAETEVTLLCRLADPSHAEIVRAALEEAGITALVRQHGPLTAYQATVVDGTTHDFALVYVPRNRLAEAQQVLTALQEAPFEWPEGMEPEEG